MIAARQQVEHRLQHADVSFHAADDDLSALLLLQSFGNAGFAQAGKMSLVE